MALIASPFPQITVGAPQVLSEVLFNEAVAAFAHALCYAYAYSTSSLLTFGYFGGRWGGFSIAAGTLALTPSSTCYIVVAVASGAISFSTSSTNWNDTLNYARVYKVATGASSITSAEDHRSGPGGVFGGIGAAGGAATTDGLEFTASSTTTDADPGTGTIRWNNSTQASATILYVDNADGDSTSLATLWATLQTGALLKITKALDANVWQLWKVNATPTNGTGYYKFAVTLQVQEGANIANGDAVLIDVDANSQPSAVTTTKGDLIVRGSSVDSRLAIGPNHAILMPDSGATLGMKWGIMGGVPLSFFGTLNNDLTTDDGALVNTALASGAKYIDARGLTIAVTTTINMVAGVYLDLRGTAISTPGSTLTTIKADTVDDWTIDLRGATITGGGSTVGTAKGVHSVGCNRGLVLGGRALNIKGHGFYLAPGSLSTPRGDQTVFVDQLSDGCYWGWEDTPGTGAEYAIVRGFRSSNCTTWGVQTSAGNIEWDGGHDIDNVGDGFVMVAGSNHAHGIVKGRSSNHNGTYNLKMTGVVNGQTFIGCHFYEKDILLDGCTGVEFIGGVIDAPHITVNTGGGECKLLGVNFQNSYGNPCTINGTAPETLITKECDGPGNPGNNDIKTKSISANYTYLINDESVVHDSADTSARTVTVNSIANLKQRVGKVLSGDNMVGAGVVTLAITTDVIVWLPTGATGSRSVAAGGNWALKLVKIASGVGTWHLSGNGIT